MNTRLVLADGTELTGSSFGHSCIMVGKSEENQADLHRLLDGNEIDLVINVPSEYDQLGRPDGYVIRRTAIDCGVPLLTDRQQLARAVIEALRQKTQQQLEVVTLGDHGSGVSLL